MKKVKIRVAVAVDPNGKWNAAGWGPDIDFDAAMDIAIDGLGEGAGEARYWVEVELDVPEVQVREGQASRAE